MQDGFIVRRRSDGSIDFDLYRMEAAALRRRARSEANSARTLFSVAALSSAAMALLIGAAALAFPDPAANRTAAQTGAARPAPVATLLPAGQARLP